MIRRRIIPAFPNSLLWLRCFAKTAPIHKGIEKGTEDPVLKWDIPIPFDYHKCGPLASQVQASRQELLDMYYEMVLIRRMETAADGLYKSRMIRGFCHLAIGQEAVAVGIEKAIDREDSIITAYRCHGFTLTRGATVASILAELMGRQSGVAKGKGGSMHMFSHEFYGGNGIVGAQVPVGAGIALAHQYRNNGRVCFALYGDGASNQGQVFEAYNMSQLWKLPVVFVCENNKYSMGTSVERGCATTELYTRGDYIPGIRVNGMDVLAVREASRFAKQYALKEGPILLEMVTYRYQGHSMSDPGTTYRTRDEIQNIRQTSDPIGGLKSRLLGAQLCDEDTLKDLDKKARDEVDAAVEMAKASPEPAVDDMYKDIYVPGSEPPWIRGCAPDEYHHVAT
jgi:pyruvate dehydrogenase E1 component alpha subunit